MAHHSLFDLSPVVHLVIMACLVAMGPLAWWWLVQGRGKHAVQRQYQLVLCVLFLTFDLVLFGAFTRLSDSGLGCPDWPGCYGQATPFGASSAIADAERLMPTGSVTWAKAWIEMIHRYLASAVGLLILVSAVHALKTRLTPATPQAWWPWLTLFWVCLQGAFGALTVTMKLFPLIVTLHLLGGLVLLALLAWQALQWRRVLGLNQPLQASPFLKVVLLGAGVVLFVQIFLGGWVSTNYAVLACNTFPQCQGRWWPDMDLAQGFEWWRGLGLRGDGSWLGMPAITAIHMVHRTMAAFVLLYFSSMIWFLYKRPGWQAWSITLAVLLLLQILTGLSNVLLDWPLVAALMHTGGSALMLLTLVGMWHAAHGRKFSAANGQARLGT